MRVGVRLSGCTECAWRDILAEGSDDAEYKEGAHTEESERCYVHTGGDR